MTDLIAESIKALGAVGIQAYDSVPRDRPKSFAVAGGLGGSTFAGGWLATVGVSVDAYAPSMHAASQLAWKCRDALEALIEAPDVTKVEPGVPYPMPTEDKLPRYEVDIDVTMNNR